MRVKGITDEDFVNYRLPSMFIATSLCSFKCNRLAGRPVCQNVSLLGQPILDIPDRKIVTRYRENPITKAVVFGGLEPMLQWSEVFGLIGEFRKSGVDDDMVIYTGYDRDEIDVFLRDMAYPNVVVKFGRYIPGQQAHMDPVLGVMLASDNQYAERIS